MDVNNNNESWNTIDHNNLHRRTVPSTSNPSNPLDPQSTLPEPLKTQFDTTLHTTKNASESAMDKASRGATATSRVVQQTFDPRRGPHSTRAQKWVLAKGVWDVLLALSLVFWPGLVYDGVVPGVVSFFTTLTKQNWERDSTSAFALASLIMGAGVAAIVAGESTSDDAYKVIAALNGVFAIMGLTGSLLHPHTYGSSFLLLASLQDVFWFFAITTAGPFPVLDTLGLSFKRIKAEADELAGRAAQRYAADGMKGVVEGTVQGVRGEGERVVGDGKRMVGEGVGLVKEGLGAVTGQVGQVPGVGAFVQKSQD